MARAVVLGANGFVGSAVGGELRRRGVETLELTRAQIDLESGEAAEALVALLRPDDCLVLVSAKAPVRSYELLTRNLRMGEAVCAALARRSLAYVLYVSSDAVYSDSAVPVSETSECAPSTLHGVMHLARETMLRSVSSVPLGIIRPTLIYGPGDPHNGYGPNRFWREALSTRCIQVFGEGEERRDHIFIGDVSRLAADMVTCRMQGALNAVTGAVASFLEIAHMTAALAGPNVNVVSIPRPGPRPHLLHRHFDVTERIKLFPAFHPTPLKVGLAAFSR